MEVGAMMVGRIVNHDKKQCFKGEEKGYFEFGGSTVIILLKENQIGLNIGLYLNVNEETSFIKFDIITKFIDKNSNNVFIGITMIALIIILVIFVLMIHYFMIND